MRIIAILITITVFVSCNNRKSDKPDDKDSNTVKTNDTLIPPKPPMHPDTALLVLSENILAAMRDSNYNLLATYIHPTEGVRFTPYGFIDTTSDQRLSAAALLDLFATNKKINWGEFDGTGDPILLTAPAYFKRFVFNANYLLAPYKAINRIISTGNSLNNLQQVYPSGEFTEFHFKGFEPKYEGQDWSSIRLVFKEENKKHWLIAIIHDQWTI